MDYPICLRMENLTPTPESSALASALAQSRWDRTPTEARKKATAPASKGRWSGSTPESRSEFGKKIAAIRAENRKNGKYRKYLD